jgi:hypothetical protein
MKSCLKKTMIVMIMITDKRGYYTEWTQRINRNDFEFLYFNKLDNLEETNKF